ncbi:unnamed protein product [Pylaiella littoralis]
MPYDVGERIRVTVGPGKTCRGLILCIGSSNGGPAYDVLLQSPDRACEAVAGATTSINVDRRKETKKQERCTGTAAAAAAAVAADANAGRELTALPASDLSNLQPFELDESEEDGNDTDGNGKSRAPAGEGVEVSVLAETLKNRGNTLFKLGDTDAAAEWFCNVLRTLEHTPVVGATVLVRMAPVPATATLYRSGMVSDANDDGGSPPLPLSYDVIYDETDDSGGSKGEQQGEEDDEEDGVEADRVLGVPSSPCVWCAARLNLARCSFRRGKQEEVVEACTLVLSLARLTMAEKKRSRDERAKLRAHCMTALRMRGGSHLAQHRVGLARKDARSMVRSSGDNEESRTQAARFEAEVERKAKALLKANRKLAKDVTQWVDASMTKHEACLMKQRKGGGDDEALPAPAPPSAGEQSSEDGGEHTYDDDGGVEETKGAGKGAGDGGVKSWLGGWIR